MVKFGVGGRKIGRTDWSATIKHWIENQMLQLRVLGKITLFISSANSYAVAI